MLTVFLKLFANKKFFYLLFYKKVITLKTRVSLVEGINQTSHDTSLRQPCNTCNTCVNNSILKFNVLKYMSKIGKFLRGVSVEWVDNTSLEAVQTLLNVYSFYLIRRLFSFSNIFVEK